MKTQQTKIGLIVLSLLLSIAVFAQSTKKESLAVFNIDSKGVSLDPVQLGNLVRIEVGKLDKFQVMDNYDMMYVIEQKQLKLENCYGKICLVEIGKQIPVDKIISGSVETYGETIIITLRLINVSENIIESTQVKEFLNLQNELSEMMAITLHYLFKQPVNTLEEQRLTKKFNYDNIVNNPEVSRLKLSGPRMGFTYYTGETAEVLAKDKHEGGFDAYPIMFQFGYQFEKQYLNEGNFQALFEFIPMITGIDQGLFLPSITIMNGLRNNVNGWEFAFGPTVYLTSEAKGYKIGDTWYNTIDMTDSLYTMKHIPETRLDSRGDYKVRSGFIVAFGKTFISGKLNIPVNAYVAPSKKGIRFGVSFGYNAKK
ncbi:MAG TPA: hypothetical protein PK734_01080 [Bacteroidales bacterium]|nr:MAG: hypothetical protein BWY22_00697 [Bacteroidetes bacterium ADurb.Bin217]HOS83526.1 hypothetical protein [Bacteroidales bacterium]HPM12063.1 hypothetical protein [Bacteroidales bacterium]